MKTYWSLGELPLGGPRRVVAIGTFDGVHLGHREVIGHARERAEALGVSAMVMTFEPNPIAVLRPSLRPAVLTPVEHKAELIGSLGVDELLIVPFTPAFARIRPDRFVEMLAGPPIGAGAVSVGPNFRFGSGGGGTVATLIDVGRGAGVAVLTPAMVTVDEKPVSSTRVRRAVAAGDVATAARLLARPHCVCGPVIGGARRGRTMGAPTANLDAAPDAALPGRGVYAGYVEVGSRRHAAAINVGLAPTFERTTMGDRPRVEAFLLDYAGEELYGRTVRAFFLERLRDERRFPDRAALAAQIERDVAETRRLTDPVLEGGGGELC